MVKRFHERILYYKGVVSVFGLKLWEFGWNEIECKKSTGGADPVGGAGEMGDNGRTRVSLVVQWPRLGPYHIARSNAAFHGLKPAGIRVIVMETASLEDTNAWEKHEVATAFERFVALPGEVYERLSFVESWRGVRSTLDGINPNVIFIHGYSTYDAWSALAWCKLHGRPAILMSDSKYDDIERSRWKESLKAMVVQQFKAALVAGSLHRIYLERLGMPTDKIFDGFDAVDNDFFWEGAERARQNPVKYRSLPGLEASGPFFLASSRFLKFKNLDGLLRAYACYRRLMAATGETVPPWRLVILGDGDERSPLEHLVHSEGIEGVSFAGFKQIDELPIYYGLASAFIHPSYKETWGLVVNEAMAAGLPVLVSNRCGCVPDLVSEGTNGYTFAPDDLSAMTKLMVRVSSGQVDLGSMSLASRNLIKEWGLNRFVQGMVGALEVALEKGPRTIRGR